VTRFILEADIEGEGPFAVAGGVAYLSADDGTHGFELWRTNGTDAGSALVVDISVGASASYPNEIVSAPNGW